MHCFDRSGLMGYAQCTDQGYSPFLEKHLGALTNFGNFEDSNQMGCHRNAVRRTPIEPMAPFSG
jgi:hypothetical protein